MQRCGLAHGNILFRCLLSLPHPSSQHPRLSPNLEPRAYCCTLQALSHGFTQPVLSTISGCQECTHICTYIYVLYIYLQVFQVRPCLLLPEHMSLSWECIDVVGSVYVACISNSSVVSPQPNELGLSLAVHNEI